MGDMNDDNGLNPDTNDLSAADSEATPVEEPTQKVEAAASEVAAEEPAATVPPTALPPQAPVAPAARRGFLDRLWGWKAAVVLALAGLLLGGLVGAGVAMAAGHDRGGRGDFGRMGHHGMWGERDGDREGMGGPGRNWGPGGNGQCPGGPGGPIAPSAPNAPAAPSASPSPSA